MEEERDLTVTWIALGLIVLVIVMGLGTFLINNFIDNRTQNTTEYDQIYDEQEPTESEVLLPPPLPEEGEPIDDEQAPTIDGDTPTTSPLAPPQD